jgi:hypothetical protein
MFELIIVGSGIAASAGLAAAWWTRGLRDDNRRLRAQLTDERYRSTVYRNALARITVMHCPPSTLADARQRAAQALHHLEAA